MADVLFYRYRWLLIRLPLALAALLLAALAWWSWYPMPSTRLTISTGQSDGAYFAHARKYAQAFERHGIELVVLPSEGSGTNLQRLQNQPPDADLALVQGGFGWSSSSRDSRRTSTVQTLGNVGIEVLWLFSRNADLGSLFDLAGMRVASGPVGSGHRTLLLRLLRQTQLEPPQVTLSELSGLAARDALLRGEVDAVFMVAEPSAPAVTTLLSTPGVYLATMRRSSAVAERNNFLESRLLLEGALGQNVPPRDTAVLTTPTHLVVRQDLDPALKRLATAVAEEVHSGSGPFHRAGELPSLRLSDFPTAPQARATLYRGLSGLERLLPFWWAQLAQRLLIIGLPLLLVTLLLARLLPICLRWRLENRVTRWYGELKFIEHDLVQKAVDLGGLEFSRINSRLDKIEESIVEEGLPPELTQRCYTLRQHVNFVRQHLKEFRGR